MRAGPERGSDVHMSAGDGEPGAGADALLALLYARSCT